MSVLGHDPNHVVVNRQGAPNLHPHQLDSLLMLRGVTSVTYGTVRGMLQSRETDDCLTYANRAVSLSIQSVKLYQKNVEGLYIQWICDKAFVHIEVGQKCYFFKNRAQLNKKNKRKQTRTHKHTRQLVHKV